MRPAVTSTPYATSSKEQTGDVIMIAQFEEGNLLSETRNDTESGDESDSESIMMSEKDMENLYKIEKLDDDLISTETLHDIRDENQTHPKIDKREARMAIRDCIKQTEIAMERSIKSYAQDGKRFCTEFSVLLYWRFCRN